MTEVSTGSAWSGGGSPAAGGRAEIGAESGAQCGVEFRSGAGSGSGAGARFRCTACGNLTRFDVTSSRRTRAFHHYTLGGDLVVEEEEVLDELVEDVVCRWCGHGRAVERSEP